MTGNLCGNRNKKNFLALMAMRTQLCHAGERIRWLPISKVSHLLKLLNSLTQVMNHTNSYFHLDIALTCLIREPELSGR
jgi:hypothetical protein